MTAFVTDERLYTIDEYLQMEENSEEKHEYYKGKITPMPGGTFNHSLIATNTSTALNLAIENSANEKFLVCNSDMKIYVPKLLSVVYPDAVVVFQQPQYYNGRYDIITNPLLVVEVTSPSTSKYDRGLKYIHYKTLPSFKEYVIIEQDFPWVTASFKTAENTWNDVEATQLDQSVFLRSINCSIDLKRIYKNVEFLKPL
jgi:Uma2 family endonuclease